MKKIEEIKVLLKSCVEIDLKRGYFLLWLGILVWLVEIVELKKSIEKIDKSSWNWFGVDWNGYFFGKLNYLIGGSKKLRWLILYIWCDLGEGR